MDRIVVAFASEEARRRILRLLESDGWTPALACASGAVSAAFRCRTVPVVGFALSAAGRGGIVVHGIVMLIIHGCLPPVL